MAFDFPNAPTIGQTYQGYVYDGEKWMSTSSPAAPNQSGVIATKVYTTSGQYTPSANMTTCVIECVGGGAGGNGKDGTAGSNIVAGGGGGGAYARKWATAATIGISQTVTVGAGGSGGPGTSTSAGGAGTDSSVGVICVAKGAPSTGSGFIPGAGGLASSSVGDFTANGSPGAVGASSNASTGGPAAGGGGGNSLLGPGAPGNIIGSAGSGTGSAATANSGGGGSGGIIGLAGGVAGGVGGTGLVVITEYGMTALSPATAQLGSVRYDLPQGLTANQTAQARANIWVTKKNYIINGAMMVSQENGTTPGTTNLYYPADMFVIARSASGQVNLQQAAGPTPGGSPNLLYIACGIAVPSPAAGDYATIAHSIEGFRAADLLWGTANAKTVTLQFGTYCSVAGTYGVSFCNATAARAYVATFTISAGEAGTNVVKTITVPGDTSGTWVKDNTIGITIRWCLYAGTTFQAVAGTWGASNVLTTSSQLNFMATVGNFFELFDVSLVEGNVAPPFQVPDYASELALCQRYYEKTIANIRFTGAVAQSSNSSIYWKVTKRGVPAIGSVAGSRSSNLSVVQVVSAAVAGARFEITSNAAGDTYALDETITANARL